MMVNKWNKNALGYGTEKEKLEDTWNKKRKQTHLTESTEKQTNNNHGKGHKQLTNRKESK